MHSIPVNTRIYLVKRCDSVVARYVKGNSLSIVISDSTKSAFISYSALLCRPMMSCKNATRSSEPGPLKGVKSQNSPLSTAVSSLHTGSLLYYSVLFRQFKYSIFEQPIILIDNGFVN